HRSVGAEEGTHASPDRQLNHNRLKGASRREQRAQRSAVARGRRMVKVAPCPRRSLTAATDPPWRSTRARPIVRRRPEREFSRVRELSARKNRSNRRDRSSLVNPSPSSATATSTALT